MGPLSIRWRSPSDKGMKIRISKTPQQRGTVQIPTPVPMPALLPAAVPTPSRMTPADGMAAVAEPRGAAKSGGAEDEAAGSEVSDGRHVLRGARAGRQAVRRGWLPHRQGADPLHHRGDEDHERDRVGILWRGHGNRAQDAHPVEYGQVLFRIDPNG